MRRPAQLRSKSPSDNRLSPTSESESLYVGVTEEDAANAHQYARKLAYTVVGFALSGFLLQIYLAGYSRGCQLLCEPQLVKSIVSFTLYVGALCMFVIGAPTFVRVSWSMIHRRDSCQHRNRGLLALLIFTVICVMLSLRRCSHVVLLIARVPQSCRHLSVPIRTGGAPSLGSNVTFITYHSKPNRPEIKVSLKNMRLYAERHGYRFAEALDGPWESWPTVGVDGKEPILPPLSDAAITNAYGVKKGPTWSKMRIIYQQMDKILRELNGPGPANRSKVLPEHWLFWADTDDVVRNHAIRLEDIIASARVGAVERCKRGMFDLGLRGKSVHRSREDVLQELHSFETWWYNPDIRPNLLSLAWEALATMAFGYPAARMAPSLQTANSNQLDDDGKDVEIILTASPDLKQVCNEKLSPSSTGAMAIRVTYWTADLFRELWEDSRFNDQLPETNIYKAHEQGALQLRLCSGNVRTEDVMEASLHPSFRNRDDISFGCEPSEWDGVLDPEATSKECTPIPLSKFRMVSIANIQPPPYAWTADERALNGDFAAHPGGDKYKDIKVQFTADHAVKMVEEENSAPGRWSCWFDVSLGSRCYTDPFWSYFY